jgi:hypothetical protein
MDFFSGQSDTFYPTNNPSVVGWWVSPEEAAESEMEEEMLEKTRANSLLNCARALENVQREVHEQNLWSAQLYSNRELAAFDWGFGHLYRASLAPISRVGENITVRVVDTLVSQLGKNRPKPKPVARGASYHLRQSIRKLDKFLYGEFQRNKVYNLTKQAFRDACIFGFGCLYVYVEKKNGSDSVCMERVFPDEILVDQMEAVAAGRLRHIYRRRVLPVEVVAATYNIDEEELKKHALNYAYLDYRPVGQGWVVVVEGYQAATDSSPGRWVVATHDKILDEGEWKYDWFPYVFFNWQTPVSGFYSPSVVEQVLPYQIRLNEINEIIRDAQDIMARPRILIAEGSRVNPLEIDNVVGRFIKYAGVKPEAITWPAMNAEIYNERERLVRSCLEHFGLSNMAATATPPPSARFDSSAAFREFNAIQDDRLSDPAQRFEQFHLDLAELIIRAIKASEAHPKTVWYSGYKKSRTEQIDWDDIDLEDNSYTMTMEAVSIYTMSPASARDELEKQLAMGLITPEQYRHELSSPDMEGLYSLQAAAADNLDLVEELLEAGEWRAPEPTQDLVSGITQMTLAMLALDKYEDTPMDVKLNFINWITLARAIVQKGTETQTASAPPGMDAGMGGDPSQMGMPGMAPPGGMGGGGMIPPGPGAVPVPEAMGLAPAGPGPMPNIS